MTHFTEGKSLRGILRIVDQGLWSGSFFIINLSTAAQLGTTSYALYSTVLAFALIGVAVSRSTGIDSQLVDGARNALPLQSSFYFGTTERVAYSVAVIVALLIAAVTAVNGVDNPMLLFAFPLWAGAMVVADSAHYALVMTERRFLATSISSAYLLLTFIAVGLSHLAHWHIILCTMLALLVLALVSSIVAIRALGFSGNNQFSRRLALGLGAESLYVGVGTQLGPLILFALGAVSATAGLRLAYTVVFSPLFSIVQALYPLLMLRVLNEAVLGNRATTTIWTWTTSVAIATAGFGFVGYIVSPHARTLFGLADFSMFLLPVGLSFVGAQILEVALLERRMSWRPVSMNLVRLAAVTIEMTLTISGALFGGVLGLILALLTIGCAKLLLGVVLIVLPAGGGSGSPV